MAEGKHTPGPWRVSPNKSYIEIASDHPDWLDNHVGQVCSSKWLKDRRDGTKHNHEEANARLIAAAPELLDALAGLLGDMAWLQKAYPAALKYTCVHCGREYHGPDSNEVLPENCNDDCPGEIARTAIAKATGGAE